MGGQNMANTVAVFIQRVIYIQNCAAGIAENGIYTVLNKHLGDNFGTIAFHSLLLPILLYIFMISGYILIPFPQKVNLFARSAAKEKKFVEMAKSADFHPYVFGRNAGKILCNYTEKHGGKRLPAVLLG